MYQYIVLCTYEYNYHLSVDVNLILPLHKLNFTATGFKPELTKKAGNGWLFKSNSLIGSVILSKECSKLS